MTTSFPGRRALEGAMTLKAALAFGLALGLLTTAAWAQDPPANGSFRVSWEPRAAGVVPTIEGRVHNDSAYRVTNVRLQIEGLDADDRLVGRAVAWALGDIMPGGETTFVVETVAGAVTYRIAVQSFDVVSWVPTP